MTSTRQGIFFGMLVVLAIAGIVAVVRLTDRIVGMEAANAELEQKLEMSLLQIEAAKGDLSKQIVDSEAKRQDEVKKLAASVEALGKAPAPEEIAKIVVAQSANDLIPFIAFFLTNNPVAADALRGKDADPVEIAKNIAKSDAFPALVVGVSKEIWETRQRDLLSNPEFVATIAAKVYESFGAELSGAGEADKQAMLIASELAKEPAFAALVAAATAK
jgi:hypothetical protein